MVRERVVAIRAKSLARGLGGLLGPTLSEPRDRNPGPRGPLPPGVGVAREWRQNVLRLGEGATPQELARHEEHDLGSVAQTRATPGEGVVGVVFAPEAKERLGQPCPAFDRSGSHLREALVLLAGVVEGASLEQNAPEVRPGRCEARVGFERGLVVPLGDDSLTPPVGEQAEGVVRPRHVVVEIARLLELLFRLDEVPPRELDEAEIHPRLGEARVVLDRKREAHLRRLGVPRGERDRSETVQLDGLGRQRDGRFAAQEPEEKKGGRRRSHALPSGRSSKSCAKEDAARARGAPVRYLSRAMEEEECPPQCDVCGEALPSDEEDDPAAAPFSMTGHGLYVWVRGDKVIYEEPPLCAACGIAIGMSALARWEIEEEEG